MKIVYFLVNGRASAEDHVVRSNMLSEGHKVCFANGSLKWGFEDSCDAVYLSSDFPIIEKWALKKDIQVIKQEVKENARSYSDGEKEETEEEKADEEVKPKRRGRKPQADKDPS